MPPKFDPSAVVEVYIRATGIAAEHLWCSTGDDEDHYIASQFFFDMEAARPMSDS